MYEFDFTVHLRTGEALRDPIGPTNFDALDVLDMTQAEVCDRFTR